MNTKYKAQKDYKKGKKPIQVWAEKSIKEDFKTCCAKKGTTQRAVLNNFIYEYIKKTNGIKQ